MNVSRKSQFFRFIILIPGSFGDVLGIENQFYAIENSNFDNLLHLFLTSESIFRLKNRFFDLNKAKTHGKNVENHQKA